jgi:hypothetical protein
MCVAAAFLHLIEPINKSHNLESEHFKVVRLCYLAYAMGGFIGNICLTYLLPHRGLTWQPSASLNKHLNNYLKHTLHLPGIEKPLYHWAVT